MPKPNAMTESLWRILRIYTLPWKDYSMKCDVSRLGCALSVGLALFGLGGRAAHAQEVIPRWYNAVFANDGYPTERAAQIAIENWFMSSFKSEDPIEQAPVSWPSTATTHWVD